MDDKFLEWLENNKEHDALKDRSYKKVLQNEKKLYNTKCIKVNTELATYGDAVLRLALCQLLWEDKVEQLTETKKKYESDEVLVKVIAKHYDMLKYIKYDEDDDQIPKDYCYNGDVVVSKNNNKHKFIATAVEACLGAIYMEKGIDTVLDIVKIWKDLIDNNNKN